MSNVVETRTASIEVIREARTYKLEIFTEKGSDYWGKLHHEVAESHDGEYKKSERDPNTNPIVFRMADIVARQDSLSYKNTLGQDQTIPAKDVPAIVTALCDALRSEQGGS